MIPFTQEEQERSVARSRKKFRMDHESDMATSWDKGKSEGISVVARNLKAAGNIPFAEIAKFTGLSIIDIERL
jgi:hypothetical protein